MTEKGLPLSDVEDAINAQPALTEDQKVALWVFAFSLRDRSDNQRHARALVAVAAEAPGAKRNPRHGSQPLRGNVRPTDRPRPREFDARGFPVPQRNRSFLERVARLLNPE